MRKELARQTGISATGGMQVAAKTPVKTPEPVRMELQPHGGALRRGGTNRGGPGRPASAVRAAFRESLAGRRHILEQIADGVCVVRVRTPDGVETETKVSASPAERIRALELFRCAEAQ